MAESPQDNNADKSDKKEIVASVEKIEPLKLGAINGFRVRLKRLLKKWGGIAALSTVVGGYAGHSVQENYRETTGYNPNKPVPAAVTPKDKEPITPKPEKGDKPKRLRDRARSWLKKAKEYAGKKFDNAKERSKLVKKYKETKQGLKKTYDGMLEFGDKSAFWGPFLIMFLATLILTNKMVEIKKGLTQNVDPAVETSLKSIASKVNELITAHNAGGAVSEGEIMNLMDTFNKDSAEIEDDLVQD